MRSLYVVLIILAFFVLLYIIQKSSKPEPYIFARGKDSSFNDIKNIPGKTPEELKAECDMLENCVGFNTQGWMKHTLKPMTEWVTFEDDPSKGFYYKASALPQ